MQLSKVEENLVKRAYKVLEKRITGGTVFSAPSVAKKIFTLRLCSKEREYFSVAFLDSQHKLIEIEDLFKGTLASCSVYPREIVKRALELNAYAIIIAHNHPSGNVEPSNADKNITKEIEKACKLLDIKLLDHLIIGGADSLSFAEKGLI